MHIEPEDISVVVQGPIIGGAADSETKRLTYRCLQSLRQHLSGAEIILSTWDGSDVSDLPFDRLVTSPDPGAVVFDDKLQTLNNLNRQLVTTKAGLAQASKKYILKFRSDLIMTERDFIDYFDRFQDRADAWNILEKRVLASTVYTRNPRRLFRLLFHPSDWVFFGLAQDIINIWDVPLADEPSQSRWFQDRARPRPDYWPRSLIRYYPEQYIWLHFLQKHSSNFDQVNFSHHADYSKAMLKVSELSIVNNLVLLEPEQFGFSFTKYKIKRSDRTSLYSHADWKRLYVKYCRRKRELHRDCIPYYIRLACNGLYATGFKWLRMIRWSRPMRVILHNWRQYFPDTYESVKGQYKKYRRTL